ncbi:MAG: TIGR04372 family glycosyltransferase [Campylobacterales bacterium]|nr:TIGR04372 family glycosyltransferase [Campylobacterales bacterium]
MKYLNRFKNIYLSPYTPITIAFQNYLKNCFEIEIKGFIDSSKQGENIYTPQDIDKLSIDKILVLSPKWDKDIYKNLLNYLDENKITVVVKSDKGYKKSIINYKFFRLTDIFLLKLVTTIFNIFNIKVINFWTNRIGEFSLECEKFLRKLELGDISKNNRYIILDALDEKDIANKVLYDLYKDVFQNKKETIFLKRGYLNRFIRHLLRDRTFYNKFFHNTEQRANDYKEFLNTKPSIQFSLEDKKKGEEILKNLNITKPYVCIFARDSKFLEETFKDRDWTYHNYRDADINTYELAIKYLIDKGYSVVRVGNTAHYEISFKHPMCIDYPFSNHKSIFADIFLTSECCLAIGTHSGILDMCNAFGKPRIGVNSMPIDCPTYSTKDDIYIPKKLKKDGKYVSLDRYFEMMHSSGLSHFQTQTYEKLNLEIEDNTPLEILDVVKEYFGDFTYNQTDAKNLEKYYEIHSKSKQFSAVKTKIGTKFLRDNGWFIN